MNIQYIENAVSPLHDVFHQGQRHRGQSLSRPKKYRFQKVTRSATRFASLCAAIVVSVVAGQRGASAKPCCKGRVIGWLLRQTSTKFDGVFDWRGGAMSPLTVDRVYQGAGRKLSTAFTARVAFVSAVAAVVARVRTPLVADALMLPSRHSRRHH